MTADLSANWTPLRPNILITGTPGTGKSTVSQQVCGELGLRHIDVGEFARDRNLLSDHNSDFNFHYMHEDAVLDALEPIMTDGGVVLDHHSSDWFPERWIQIVVVLRASTEALYDRLEARGYAKPKLDENMQAEIMQVCRDEAIDSYPKAKVLELDNSLPDMQTDVCKQIKNAWNTLLTARNQDGTLQQ